MAAVPEFTPEKGARSWVPLTTVLDTTARWQSSVICRIQTPVPTWAGRGHPPAGSLSASSPRPGNIQKKKPPRLSTCWPGDCVYHQEMCILKLAKKGAGLRGLACVAFMCPVKPNLEHEVTAVPCI